MLYFLSLGVNWKLQAEPSEGIMYGGHDVYVSGPCFTSNMKIRCRFGQGRQLCENKPVLC